MKAQPQNETHEIASGKIPRTLRASRKKTRKQIQYELSELAEFILDRFEEKQEQRKQNSLNLIK